jgi:hypothetical protein
MKRRLFLATPAIIRGAPLMRLSPTKILTESIGNIFVLTKLPITLNVTWIVEVTKQEYKMTKDWLALVKQSQHVGA